MYRGEIMIEPRRREGHEGRSHIKSVGIGIIHLSLLETLRPLRPLRFNYSKTIVNDFTQLALLVRCVRILNPR